MSAVLPVLKMLSQGALRLTKNCPYLAKFVEVSTSNEMFTVGFYKRRDFKKYSLIPTWFLCLKQCCRFVLGGKGGLALLIDMTT